MPKYALQTSRYLSHCLFFGVLLGLALLRGEAQGAPTSQEPVRKEQVQEIEKYLGQVEEGDRPTQYMVYVVLSALSLMVSLAFLRRFLLR